MVSQFNTTQGECKNIAAAVESARAELLMKWQSDAAAPKFLQAIDQWMAGFQRVRQSLDLLNENMQTYSNLTASTEDTTTSYAGGWATP
ncbi:hypothetical protein GVV04_03730 [Micromonospora sp. NEAU-HG-1]|nr:hypothetical protein [Micromonospora rubida]